ncbi:hypothetical protein, partial [Escherichia coli]|uniref:hypothetical protein n=1 Tax=Escherichia coli TaxID=562 RepID=UPI0019542EB3
MNRTIGTTILLFAATTGAAAKPTVYRCMSSGLAEITLNLSDHRYRMAGAAGPLNEGLWFNFTT